MRSSLRRKLFCAALMFAGIAGIKLAQAVEPTSDADLKTLVDQDAKNIDDMIKLGTSTKKKGDISKASRAVKSNAMMIALYANNQIGGKNANADAKFAALRDAALKVAADGGAKKFAAAAPVAKTLNLNIAAGKGNAQAMTLAQLNTGPGMDLEELMHQLKKQASGGLGIEEEIKANAKSLKLKPDEVSALATRIEGVAQYCEIVTPEFGGAKTKTAWEGFTKDMRTAAAGLKTAAAGKNPKAIQTAFDKLDRSCIACHEIMK